MVLLFFFFFSILFQNIPILNATCGFSFHDLSCALSSYLYFKDPLHPLDIGELFAKLQQGNDEVQEVVQELSPGHSASSETNTFTNLYLVIDLADDVGDDILEHSIAFAEDRVVTVQKIVLFGLSIV